MIEALRNLGTMLQNTHLSQVLNESTWVIPLLQTLHILSIAGLMIAALVINGRVLRLSAMDRSLIYINDQFFHWIWWALPILLVTGSLLVISEPGRSLTNPAFIAKMLLVILSVTLALFIQKSISKTTEYDTDVSAIVKISALASTAMWLGILFLGRWIAYILSW